MIIGIGTDIVYIPRIARIWKKHGVRFLNKVFSNKEIIDSLKYTSYHMKASHFAKRFAAKEAYVKALGIGFGKVKMKEISIYNESSGRPGIFIESSSSFIDIQDYKLHLSITDEKNYAVALVIIEQ